MDALAREFGIPLLNAREWMTEDKFSRAGEAVKTRFEGELARLLGIESSEIDAHRLDSVRRAASRFGAVVLLKGPDTLIASPREGVLVATILLSLLYAGAATIVSSRCWTMWTLKTLSA